MKKLFLGIALLAGTMAASAVTEPVEGTVYNIKNTTGFYLNAGTKLSMEDLDGTATAQRFTVEVVDAAAKVYAIKCEDGRYIGTDGGWSAAFATDCTSDKFQVTLNAASIDGFVTILFKGKEVGFGADYGVKAADNTDKTIYTDKKEASNNAWSFEVAPKPVSITTPDPNKYYLIRHYSGGYFTEKDGWNASVAPLQTGDLQQIYQFVPVDGQDGVYNIKRMTTGYYISSHKRGNDSKTNSWSVLPLARNTKESQYTIKSVTADGDYYGYVMLANVGKGGGEGSYLGTDANDATVYTDKDGKALDRHTWWLEEVTLPKKVYDLTGLTSLLVNGDFQSENFAQTSEGRDDELTALTELEGWTASTNVWGIAPQIVEIEEGVNALCLQAYSEAFDWAGSTVKQTIAVKANHAHVLSFDYLINNDNDGLSYWSYKVTEKRRGTVVGPDGNEATGTVNYELCSGGGVEHNTEWQTMMAEFTPESTEVTVEFNFTTRKSWWRNRNAKFNNVAVYDVAPENPYEEYALPATDPRKNAYEGYQLVFAEEFSDPAEDLTEIWNFEYGFKRNNEAQLYYKNNTTWVEDGVCMICAADLTGRMQKNPVYNKYSDNASIKNPYMTWVSGSMISKGQWDGGYSWLFGIWEVRAKVPQHTGCWPAIWSTGRQWSWPQGGEIDILEYYGNKIHGNVCYGNTTWNSATISNSELGSGWGDEYHTWRMVWEYDHMELWCDDWLVNYINLDTTYNPVSEGKEWSGRNPFREVRNIVWLNLAMGGNAGGSLSNTPRPSYYLIDYARVYQKIGTDGKATYHVDEEISAPAFKYKDGQMHPLIDERFEDKSNGIYAISVDSEENLPVEFYNLQGIRVNEPVKGQPYIQRQGNTATKVIF